jgi:hypothetical protein
MRTEINLSDITAILCVVTYMEQHELQCEFLGFHSGGVEVIIVLDMAQCHWVIGA